MQKTVTVDGNQIVLNVVTGAVLNTTKAMETSMQSNVSGGGGSIRKGSGRMNDIDVSVTSTTIIHDQVFLADENGREHSFQFQNFNVACREGNSLSVLLLAHANNTSGPCVAVINNTTENRFFNNAAIRNVCKPEFLHYLLGIVAAIILTCIFVSGWRVVFLLIVIPFVFTMLFRSKTDRNVEEFRKSV